MVNEIIEVIIEDFGIDGEGVGRYGGLVVFVAGGVPGDKIRVKISAVKKGAARAEIVEILEYSGIRVKPACESFGACGGCRFLHVNYESELKYKKKRVNDALRRIGGFNFEIDEIIGMDTPCYYRNKAVYHTALRNGKTEIGFYAAKSNRITPVAGCVMFGSACDIIIAAFKEYIRHGANGIKDITVRLSSRDGGVLINVSAVHKSLPRVNALAEAIKAGLAGTDVFGKPAYLAGLTLTCPETKTLWGEGFILDKIGGFVFKISSETFFQVNSKMTESLYKRALEFAQLTGSETVIDAYAGAGTLSVFVSPYAKEVIGIELVHRAVLDAERNIKLNGVSNARFIQGESGNVMRELYKSGVRPDVIIIDPPRSGCEAGAVSAIESLAPDRIVYVSCDAATLARDLKKICAFGYKIENGACVDMFARSAHVECVIGLSRNNK